MLFLMVVLFITKITAVALEDSLQSGAETNHFPRTESRFPAIEANWSILNFVVFFQNTKYSMIMNIDSLLIIVYLFHYNSK